MKKIIIFILLVLLTSCKPVSKFPQSFDEAEKYFDELHKPITLNKVKYK